MIIWLVQGLLLKRFHCGEIARARGTRWKGDLRRDFLSVHFEDCINSPAASILHYALIFIAFNETVAFNTTTRSPSQATNSGVARALR